MRMKYIAFVLILILVIFPNGSWAERKGAKLQIQKKDSTFLSGELIAVKNESVLLLDSNTGVDVSVALDDIKVIEIVKKRKVLLGGGLGLVFGTGIGVVSGYMLGDDEPRAANAQGDFKIRTAAEKALINGILFGLIGVIGGIVVGSEMEKSEIIYFQDISPEGKAETLRILSSKARIPDVK